MAITYNGVKYLDANELSVELKYSTGHIGVLRRAGEIPFLKKGGRYYYDPEQVMGKLSQTADTEESLKEACTDESGIESTHGDEIDLSDF